MLGCTTPRDALPDLIERPPELLGRIERIAGEHAIVREESSDERKRRQYCRAVTAEAVARVGGKVDNGVHDERRDQRERGKWADEKQHPKPNAISSVKTRPLACDINEPDRNRKNGALKPSTAANSPTRGP